MIGAVWGEYVGAQTGLGIFMQRAQHAFQVPLVFAAIIVIATLSVGLFLLLALVERAVIPWHFRARGVGAWIETIKVTPQVEMGREVTIQKRPVGGKN